MGPTIPSQGNDAVMQVFVTGQLAFHQMYFFIIISYLGCLRTQDLY